MEYRNRLKKELKGQSMELLGTGKQAALSNVGARSMFCTNFTIFELEK